MGSRALLVGALVAIAVAIGTFRAPGREWVRRNHPGASDAPDQAGWPTSGARFARALRRAIPGFRERAVRRNRAAATEAIVAFAAEVSSGAPPPLAIQRVAATLEVPVVPHAATAARFGGDVVAALRRDAQSARLPSLRAFASIWEVAEQSGAGMAVAARRLAQAEAANDAVRRELASQLAGPKSSARVLAALPLFGLALGSGLGGSPIEWLLTTRIGEFVAVAGLALEVAGLAWVSRIVRSVERQL